MPIQTDLSVSPYFDDFSENKDYYKVLFRPGVSVQARELNQLQTILQNQIERFGNNIFKQGTIVDSCDIAFHPDLQYIKIKDTQTDSEAVDVQKYLGYRIKNQQTRVPLEASIIAVDRGFESTAPDLNTLYVRYLNTGFDVNDLEENGRTKYTYNEQLTLFNPDNVIEKINVDDGSSGFGINDNVVILPAIAIQNTTGGTAFANNFFVNDFISDGTANVQIIEILDNVRDDAIILRIAPRIEDLKAKDYSKWTLSVNTNIQTTNTTPSSLAKIVSHVGSGAAAEMQVSSLGQITNITVTQKGSGYTVLPYVAVASASAQFSQLDIFSATARNYLANITVAPQQYNPIGDSYGMTVGNGVIYQKGYFSRVEEQLVIVEKYNNVPDQISVGFTTDEDIIDSNEDQSLLDNATGAPNYTAPGANRLQLKPKLTVLTKAEADTRSDWLYIAEFSEGQPYKQNRQTVYNIIGNEISRRSFEESGNYVTNPFLLNTKNANTFNYEATKFNIVIDPGSGYINGNRVETLFNYEAAIDKGIDTRAIENGNISMNYGNYVRVKQLAGNFIFKTGDRVDLYGTAGTWLLSNPGATPSNTSLGTVMGQARIRSIVYESGVAGSPDAVYRLYLFDIRMDPGKNFDLVRSVFYDGTNKAVADVVLENGKAVVKDNTTSSLIFYSGSPAVVNASAISYIYRTVNSYDLTTSGTITFSVPSAGTEKFPYTGQLSSTQKRDLIVVPLANTAASTNLSGAVNLSTTSSEFISSNPATSYFLSEIQAGDWISVGTLGYVQIKSVANNSHAALTANSAFDAAANTFKLGFPANAPIPMDREERTITNNVSQNQLVIDLATALETQVSTAVTFNVREESIIPVTKTANRNRYVRMHIGTHPDGAAGPWPIGVSDVFRLNKVYKGANNTFGTSGPDVVDVTKEFYIDHNQTEDYYGISWLYKKPNSTLTLSSDDRLLVDFDYFTHTEGLKAPGGSGTYNINDGVALEDATTTINTLEIPEVYGTRGTYYDLRDQFDLRPNANGTIVPSSSATVDVPLNPADQGYGQLFTSNDKKFPAPDSELSATINYYQGRVDRVIIDESNQFRVIKGTPGSNEPAPAPENALTINLLQIPPYPSQPYILSAETTKYVDTKIANEKYTTQRLNNYRVTTPVDASQRLALQPRGYTMQEIGQLERRIADLEYYTSLTLTETLAQKRSIPGYDGSDRFKFGFFVDGFEDYKYADVSNPAYSATIVDGYLSPLVDEMNIGMSTSGDNDPTLPYTDIVLVGQTRATDGPLTAETVNTYIQTIVSVVQSERNRNRSDNGYVYEDFFYTFSAAAGPCEFYINSRDNWVGCEILQSNSPDGPWTQAASSRTALAITKADVYTKQLSSLNNTGIEHLGELERKSSPVGRSWGTWLEDQFKLSWIHNPALGQYVMVRIYKGGRHGGFFGGQGKAGTFGYKLFYPTDTVINSVAPNVTSNYQLSYNGLVFDLGNLIF